MCVPKVKSHAHVTFVNFTIWNVDSLLGVCFLYSYHYRLCKWKAVQMLSVLINKITTKCTQCIHALVTVFFNMSEKGLNQIYLPKVKCRTHVTFVNFAIWNMNSLYVIIYDIIINGVCFKYSYNYQSFNQVKSCTNVLSVLWLNAHNALPTFLVYVWENLNDRYACLYACSKREKPCTCYFCKC